MVLVAAFLLTHSSRWRDRRRSPHISSSSHSGEQCLGVLLVDMLRLYGREFNSQDVGVSLRYGGQFLPRYEMECGKDDPSTRWVVEDPNNKENNLAGGSFGIFKVWKCVALGGMTTCSCCCFFVLLVCATAGFPCSQVRQALDFAYQVLTAPKLHPNEPLLSRVVRYVLLGVYRSHVTYTTGCNTK